MGIYILLLEKFKRFRQYKILKIMISKKVENLKQFTIILTIGAIINQSGNFLFKIISLFILSNNDYGLFSITLSTFNIFIPISSFLLHNPLTRDIRKAKDSIEITKIYQNYSICYLITSLSIFFIFIIVGGIFLKFLDIFLVVFLSLNLIFYAFSEFFIGISRGDGMPIKSILINAVNGLIRGFLAFFSLFIIFFQNFETFIIFFGLGYIGSFSIGIALYYSPLKDHLFKNKSNFIEKDRIKVTFKKSSLLLFDNFISRFNLWLVTYIAYLILNAFSFKIFDLALMMIIIVKFLGDSLNIATNSKRNLGKFNKKSKNESKYLVILISLNIFSVFFLFFTNVDLVILKVFFGDIPKEAHLFLRWILLIPIPLIINAYFYGRAQNFGNYSDCVKSKILGFIGSVLIYFPAVIIGLADLLIIGLILEKMISAIFIINFEIKRTKSFSLN